MNCENRAILKKISISAIAVLYDIATVIWYYIAIKNFIFVFKILRYIGIISIHDWKAALSLMFKFGYIWDLILAILFTALNVIIAVLLTRMALGKQFSKKLKILLCVLLGILLVFFILVPFYTYLWALYAVFRRIRLISVFAFVYFVIIVGALAFNIFALKSKDTKDFLQHSNKTPTEFRKSAVQKRKVSYLMKRIKEILLLLVLFIIFFFLNLVLCTPSLFAEGSYPAFAGGIYYLKLILSDKTFFVAIINTFRKPLISSVVLISLSCAILKNKIKFTRKSFYLTAFATSFIISVAYLILNVALNNVLGYIFIPIQIGLLCLMVFWGLELIVNTIKNFRRKRDEI